MTHLAKTDRGGIVVVADPALADALRHANGVSVTAVDHYLAALGEMSRAPVDAVVGRMGPLRSDVEPTVSALRALSPRATLLLVVEAHQEPEARRAVRLGFDDYIVEPVEPVAITRAIEQRTSPRTAAQLPDRSEAEAAPTPAIASADPDDSALVDQFLRERAGVCKLALEMIRRRLNCDDITFCPQRSDEAKAQAPVQYGQAVHGYLLSASLDESRLASSAQWLGRWLALEHQISHLQDMALKDPLTGVWNRRYFDRFLGSIVERAREERFRVTLMLFDIDRFKQYNDQFGHPAGDEILRESARLMASVVRKHDVVARIGGDEFGVIFWDAEPPRRNDSEHPRSVRKAAMRFRRMICSQKFPKLAHEAPDTLTISAGLASFPWDGQTADELVDLADQMLLQSKQGKDAITFGPGALQECDLEFGEDDPPAED